MRKRILILWLRFADAVRETPLPDCSMIYDHHAKRHYHPPRHSHDALE